MISPCVCHTTAAITYRPALPQRDLLMEWVSAGGVSRMWFSSLGAWGERWSGDPWLIRGRSGSFRPYGRSSLSRQRSVSARKIPSMPTVMIRGKIQERKRGPLLKCWWTEGEIKKTVSHSWLQIFFAHNIDICTARGSSIIALINCPHNR